MGGAFTDTFDGYLVVGPKRIQRDLGTLTNEWTDIVPGITVREIVESESGRRWWRAPRFTRHRVEVKVDPAVRLGRIWIARVPLTLGYPDMENRVDLFRRGLFRVGQEPTLFYHHA